jgi:hypothetical protein
VIAAVRSGYYHLGDNSSRAEINPQPRKSRSPVRNWLLLASGCVSAMVQVPPDQSLTSRSVVKPEGKPGNGSPKPDESRMQALYPKGISAGHRAPKNRLSVVL